MTTQPSQFEIHPSSGVPIFRQIIEQVQALLAGRRIQPGDMLPSVRQMAAELGVNPMTISKAYARLEADGIVERVRGKGMAILPQTIQGSVVQRQRELESQMQAAVNRGRQLGLNDEQIEHVLRKLLRETPQ
ncbi:GntR family transcriptional regulator [Planctomicrobium sp. SH527]|uniref:GntR family transcriptional regulator n=1 Tax=Planctomicrobium sp. SH527 TaxID=3448123 RepID=UPI003F5B8984